MAWYDNEWGYSNRIVDLVKAPVKTLRDLGELDGKRVLVRVDFNVPLRDGEITDDTRIRAAMPTIEWLRERGARVVLVSHLGRPKDRESELSMRPAADRLAELTGADVTLAPAVVGEDVRAFADNLANGDVLMLENVRYEPGETKNDPELAQALANVADVYVNDAFGAAHRAHASTEGVAHLVDDRAAGLLLEREVSTLEGVLKDPARPLVAVLAGPRSRTRSPSSNVPGGGRHDPDRRRQLPVPVRRGPPIGASLCAPDDVELARRLLDERGGSRATLELPSDLARRALLRRCRAPGA